MTLKHKDGRCFINVLSSQLSLLLSPSLLVTFPVKGHVSSRPGCFPRTHDRLRGRGMHVWQQINFCSAFLNSIQAPGEILEVPAEDRFIPQIFCKTALTLSL